MIFKKEDFSLEFRRRFNDEELQILINFCESYNKRFGKYTTKQEIIDKISHLEEFSHFSDENSFEIAGHVTELDSNCRKIIKAHIRINNAIYNKLSIDEKKATIYHELIHHFSAIEKEGKPVQLGLVWGVKQREPSYLDEVMTEFYATELLKAEGIDIKKYYLIKQQTKTDLSQEVIRSDGSGYGRIAGIGKTYNSVLGKRIFDGKTKDFAYFEKFFNEKFKSISNISAMSFVNKQIYSAFNTTENLQGADAKNAIYDCYKTALNIFDVDKNNTYNKKGFDLYDYLKHTQQNHQMI